ncbi:MAG: SNF2-like, partial [Naasia sp.]|nr:SNF2-like [Naasia sp.]
LRPIVAGHGAKELARLRKRIRPLMMRRTKELVAADLPEKQEQDLRKRWTTCLVRLTQQLAVGTLRPALGGRPEPSTGNSLVSLVCRARWRFEVARSEPCKY